MKPSSFLTCALTAVLLPAVAFAADDKPRKRRGAPPHGAAAEAFKPFDKNDNHQIDPDELPALQQSFAALKKLDANSNGEIEQAELDTLKSTAPERRQGRAFAGLRQADKNGNRKIDPEEIEALQKVAAGSKMMERLDRNSNGKLDPDEVERLNERISKGVARSRPGASKPPATQPSEEPAKTPALPPAETAKPELNKKQEKADDKPAGFTPEIKPLNSFGT